MSIKGRLYKIINTLERDGYVVRERAKHRIGLKVRIMWLTVGNCCTMYVIEDGLPTRSIVTSTVGSFYRIDDVLNISTQNTIYVLEEVPEDGELEG